MCLPKNVKGSTIQKIAATVGNLLCFNFGLIFGITPPHMRLYQTMATPLNAPIDVTEATWVASYLFVGAAIGALCFGWLSQKIGLKSVLLLSGLMQICGWFCIHFGYDIIHIYSSRLFAGVAAGGAFVALPIYIADITQDPHGAALTASIEVWRALGIMFGFILGFYLKYDLVNIIGICCSLVFSLVFPFMQESPFYYLSKGNMSSMEKSLRWFRGIRDIDDRTKPEFLRELQEIKIQAQEKGISEPTMSRGYTVKIFTYSLLLVVGAQLCGSLVILNYSAKMISEHVTIASPNVHVLILAGIQIFGAIIASSIGAKIGRSSLLFVTGLLSGCALIAFPFLAISNAFLTAFTQTDACYINLIPLCLLGLYFFAINIGIHPFSTVVVGEILPTKLRTNITSIVHGLSWLLLFLLIQYFHIIITLGSAVILWFFGGVCVLYAVLAIFLPETRGKPLEEVQQNMGYITNGNIAKISTISNGHITQGHI